jgi:HEAT repeat protein
MSRTNLSWMCITVVLLAVGCNRGDESESADGDLGKKRPVNRGAIEAQSQPLAEPYRPQIPERWPAYREWTMREVSIDSLGRIGAAAVPALVEVLTDPNPVLRQRAAQALARIGPDARDAVPDLIVALQDRDEEVRKSVARALGQIGPEARAAVPALLDELKAAPIETPES